MFPQWLCTNIMWVLKIHHIPCYLNGYVLCSMFPQWLCTNIIWVVTHYIPCCLNMFNVPQRLCTNIMRVVTMHYIPFSRRSDSPGALQETNPHHTDNFSRVHREGWDGLFLVDCFNCCLNVGWWITVGCSLLAVGSQIVFRGLSTTTRSVVCFHTCLASWENAADSQSPHCQILIFINMSIY